MVRALTEDPASFGAEHIAPVLAAGVSKAAIEDAIAVCGLFQVVNRIADALEFRVPSAAADRRSAQIMWRTGYALPGLD